jgi:polygalacturonase
MSIEPLDPWLEKPTLAMNDDMQQMSVQEELSTIRKKTNECVDLANQVEANKEDISDLETNRKLGANGDFKGTWFGVPFASAEPQLSAEVIQARGDKATLNDKLVEMNTLASDTNMEVTTARGSESSLDGRLDKNDSIVDQMGISVVKYGAKCDGVTDDTTAVQTALNSVPANSTVFIPPHTKWDYRNLTIHPDNILINDFSC